MKSTESLWIATSPSSGLSSPPLPDRADVVIVGAGITGLTAALLLRATGRSVVVLEKGRVAEGESGLTTAHITQAVDVRYTSIKRSFGADAARLVATAGTAAIDRIEENIRQYRIECGFHRVPGYLYSESRKDVAPLKNEAAAAQDAGLAVAWDTAVPLPFPTRGAVRFDNQARFHPRQYLLGLAAQCRDSIHEETAFERLDGEFVETNRGRVAVGHVVFATNAPLNDVAIHTRVTPYRSYAIALDAPPDGLADALFWDTDDPYHYIRLQETEAGTLLIVGGEDHRVGEERESDECYERLLAWAVKHFGELPLRYRWSGQIIEPADGLPFIGRTDDRTFVATGYAGQGMTMGTAAAMLIADLIEGRENVWAPLFDPKRIHATGLGEVLKHNIDVVKHFAIDKLTDVKALATAEVHAGEGKIVVMGGRKVALARDASGTLHAVSPVCTHLKCDVRWNSAETSWDCPCHGSRYSIDGSVLNGPATEALERIAVEDDDGSRL